MSKKHTYEYIKYFIEVESESGCELISKEYKGVQYELEIKCKCGGKFNVRFDSFKFKNQRRCKKCTGADKVTRKSISNVKEILLNLGYILLDDKYKNNNTKINIKDIDGYLYFSRLHDITSGHKPDKFNPRNPYVIHNIKLWCRLNDKPFELLDNQEYKGNNKKLKWQCLKPECGEIFETTLNPILQDGGCGFCHGLQVGLSNCLVTKNPILASEWHPIKNGDLTPYDVTCGSNQDIWWQCDKGHEWNASVAERNVGNGCPYCAGKLPSEDYNLLIDNPELCEEWDYSKNDKNPEDYTPGANQYVWWICKKCGYEWKAHINARNKKNGKSTGCPRCKESHGEKRIARYFKNNNVYYSVQYRFKDCKNKRTLPFDFAWFNDKEKTNLYYLVEYDGILHFEDKFNNPLEFNRLKTNDEIKNQYCKNNNIRLLRIPYWDFDNIEIILDKFLRKEEYV